jgi:hypothetical protein
MPCDCCKTGSNCRRYNHGLFGCGFHYGKGYCAPHPKFTELDPLEFDLDFTFAAANGFDLAEFGIPPTVSRKGYNYRGPGWTTFHESNGIYTEDYGDPHNLRCDDFEATPGRLKIFLELLHRAPVTPGDPPVFWLQEGIVYDQRAEYFREGSWVCCFIPERFRNYLNQYRNLNFRGKVDLDSIQCDPFEFIISGELRMDLVEPAPSFKVSTVTVATFSLRVHNAKKWQFPGPDFWTGPPTHSWFGKQTWTLTTCRHAPHYLNPSDTPQIPLGEGYPGWPPDQPYPWPGDERGLCPGVVDTTRHTKWRACVTWTEFSGSYLPAGVANGFSLDLSTCSLIGGNPTSRVCDYEDPRFTQGHDFFTGFGPGWITGTNRPADQEGQPYYGADETGTDIELKVDGSRPVFGFGTDPYQANYDENLAVYGSFSTLKPNSIGFLIGGLGMTGSPFYHPVRPTRPIQIESTVCNQDGTVFRVVFKDVPVYQVLRGWPGGTFFVGYLRVQVDLTEYTQVGSCDRVTVTPPTCPAGPPPTPPPPVSRFWCVGGSCVEATTTPAGATGGPYATAEECSGACQPAPPSALWYCSGGFCVQASTPPAGSLVGYPTEADCRASCSSIPPNLGGWWCVPDQNGCVQSLSQPPGATSGPHPRKVDCDFGCVPPPDYPLWWCLFSGGCLESWTRPEDSNGMAYPNQADCLASCNPTPNPYPGFYCVPVTNPTAEVPGPFTCISWGGTTGPPQGAQGGKYPTLEDCVAGCNSGGVPYWCVDPSLGRAVTPIYDCVQAETAPPGTVSGPYASAALCSAGCGPATSPETMQDTGTPPTLRTASGTSPEIRARYSLPCVHRGEPIANSGFT